MRDHQNKEVPNRLCPRVPFRVFRTRSVAATRSEHPQRVSISMFFWSKCIEDLLFFKSSLRKCSSRRL